MSENEKPTLAFWTVVVLTFVVALAVIAAGVIFFMPTSAPAPIIFDSDIDLDVQ